MTLVLQNFLDVFSAVYEESAPFPENCGLGETLRRNEQRMRF